MWKKRSGGKLLNALLATTWDKEGRCMIKTVSCRDSFVLLGSSEQIVEKTGHGERLTSVVIDTPKQGEEGLVGMVLMQELEDTFCRRSDAKVIKKTILFILMTSDWRGRPRTKVSETWIVPLAKVQFSVDDDFFVELVTSLGKFTTNFRKAYESDKNHIWYVPARKMFCFLVRPSCEFLLEAAKCAYFERLALRRDDLLRNLMGDIFERDEELQKRDAHLFQLTQELALARSSVENYKRRVDVVEKELFDLEGELTTLCREQDARMILEPDDASRNALLRKRIEELEFELEDSAYFKADVEKMMLGLREILSKKRKETLYDSLSQVLNDFPWLLPLHTDECA